MTDRKRYTRNQKILVSGIRTDVAAGKLEVGRVYEISPAAGHSKLMRAIAFCPDSNAQRATSEAAKGLYSEFRRLRHAEEIAALPISA